VISPTDPRSAWTAKVEKRVQFGCGLNYLIDIMHAVIIDIGATPARTYDKLAATRTRIDSTEKTSGVEPELRAADTARGLQKLQYVSFTPLTVDFFNGIDPALPFMTTLANGRVE
jgi:hypothetical protein